MTELFRAKDRARRMVAVLVVTSAVTSAVASCAAPTPSEERLEGNRVDGFASSLTVLNDGPVVLTDVKVRTSEQDSVVIATLEPGQSRGPFGIAVMHESPIVMLKAQGRALLLHPVEGFAAFNAKRPAGSYVVKLRPGREPNQIDLRISPP